MTQNKRTTYFSQLMQRLNQFTPGTWGDILEIVDEIKDSIPIEGQRILASAHLLLGKATAFVTFDFGIDGVSVEIGKYARALEKVYESAGGIDLHFIAGEFYPQAEAVLDPKWNRFTISGINGWSKWDDGKWFNALYYEEMPAHSQLSNQLAQDIYHQAVNITQQLGEYIVEKGISLLVTVNIASNPGNLALILAVALITEGLCLHVINSNHDFYWEGGTSLKHRKPGDEPNIRDHFFRNEANELFFNLFQSLYPWNGRRWLQVNINQLQSRELIEVFGFKSQVVSELSTAVSDAFFKPHTFEDIILARVRMGLILSDGEDSLQTKDIKSHRSNLTDWMKNQKPCVLGARSGITLDPTSRDYVVLLQPTRVIARKRIERDVHLIGALLNHPPFREIFKRNEKMQIVLHITGPTPIEHREDLETVLVAYQDVLVSESAAIGERIFLAFSVGNEEHSSFIARDFDRMTIEDIYKMATVVVFPSEIEGRGLPIIESSASGVPLICSRYKPEEVFESVVGEGLPFEEKIRYIHFPETNFSDEFLDEVTGLLTTSETSKALRTHNRAAVRSRYSQAALTDTFKRLLEKLELISEDIHTS